MVARWKPEARRLALAAGLPSLDDTTGDVVAVLVTSAADTDELATAADLAAIEVVDAGYSRAVVTWQALGLDEQGVARAVFDDLTFGPFAAPVDVAGYYLAKLGGDDESTTLLWFGELTPTTIAAADSLAIVCPLSGAVVLS